MKQCLCVGNGKCNFIVFKRRIQKLKAGDTWFRPSYSFSFSFPTARVMPDTSGPHHFPCHWLHPPPPSLKPSHTPLTPLSSPPPTTLDSADPLSSPSSNTCCVFSISPELLPLCWVSSRGQTWYPYAYTLMRSSPSITSMPLSSVRRYWWPFLLSPTCILLLGNLF